MQARMYGIGKAGARSRAEAAIAAFELADFAERLCRTYSGGQRRRLDIALGVIHRPRVQFLDEPTVGLDPQSRARLWDEVRRLREEDGMTVFLTTHYLDEADALCDRVSIIDHGEIVAEGTPLELKRDIAGDVVTLGVNGSAAVELLGQRPFVRRLETSKKGLLLYVDDASTAIPQILRALDGSGIAFEGMELNRPTLDDVFLTKTGRLLRECKTMKLLRDTWLVFTRQMLLVVRTPIRLVIGFAQPITYLILFAPLLKSALAPIGATSYADAYRIYVPGLLVILLMLGSFFSGFALLAELREGVIERSRVTPVSRFALLFGRAISEVVTLLGQAIVITVAALPLGLRVSFGPLLLAYVPLVLIGLVGASVLYAVALSIKNPAALGPLINVVQQPLALLSGVLLPLALAPAWLVAVAKVNPFYWATNGTRDLFAGNLGAAAVWQGMAVMGALAVVAIWWATRLFARQVH